MKRFSRIGIFAALLPRPERRGTLTCRSFFSPALGATMEYRIFLPPPAVRKGQERPLPGAHLLHGYNFVRNKPDQSGPNEGANHWMDQETLGPVATCLMTVGNYDALRTCMRDAKLTDPDEIANEMQSEYPDNPLPLPPMIIVMPEGSTSFYVNRRDGKKLYPPPGGPQFVDGLRTGATGMFEDYIVKDLVVHVDRTYRTVPDRAHRAVGGSRWAASAP